MSDRSRDDERENDAERSDTTENDADRGDGSDSGSDRADSNGADSDSGGAEETNRTGERADGEVVTYDERETPLSGLADRAVSEAETTLPVVDDEESRDLEADTDPDGTEADSDRAGPLGELAAELDDRGRGSSAFDDLFERENVDGIDSDALWEQIEREEFDDALLADREIREVRKRAYCHQCEHFSAPPEVACENEGTDVLELTSLDTFRVADCPFVLEDEELENGDRT